MASYLDTTLFFCDSNLPRTAKLSWDEIAALVKREPPCFRASSRHGDSAERIAALLAARDSVDPRLDFIASKGGWPYAEPWIGVLPFEDLIPIATSIEGLLAWCVHSIPLVTRILYFDSAEQVQEALQAPEICAYPNEASGADFDGYGARFIFSLLASIAALARDAHASQRALIAIRG
jgi:hypothetical protein